MKNWFFTDPNDGCFLLNAGLGQYVIKVRPKSGTLTGNNTVRVNNKNGALKTFSVTTPFIGTSLLTYEVVLPSKAILRIYTVLTFAIERAFRGRYENKDLIGWKEKASGDCNTTQSAGSRSCTINGDPNVIIDGTDHTRRFVIAHEYGHANMRHGAGGRQNDCDVVDVDDSIPGGHRLRGREISSCAASEGWAHFVSGDVFNWHGGGSSSPQALIQYVDGGNWDLGPGGGGCPGQYPLPNSALVGRNALRQYVDCSPSSLDPSEGTEMDWARLWWRYHEDTDYPGSPRGHSKLHDDLVAAGPWGATSAYFTMFFGLGTTLGQRWASAADDAGVCDGPSC
ncbi:MAG: hypothetical protein AAGA54_35335 [Myxococcota bacterium]